MTKLTDIALQFTDTVTALAPLGNGLINDTFLVTSARSALVLQRINRVVFPQPTLIMDNLRVLNQHLQQKSADILKLEIPTALSTRLGQAYFEDADGDIWRALSFIADTDSLETVQHTQEAKQTGWALAHFHGLVSDLPPALLHDTLPGFHIAPDYLRNYQQVAHTTAIPDDPLNAYCTSAIAQYQHWADDLETAKHTGELKLRVIHGDPKLNNFLFAKTSGRIISLIDLDTVKPGLVHYDIGDCLRSCCHNSDDDSFNLSLCRAVLKSYLAEAKHFFTAADYQYLYPAIRLIPFELGLRFYTDYLQGNRYFKVTEPLQNLHRAAAQLRLCASINAQETAIKALIAELGA